MESHQSDYKGRHFHVDPIPTINGPHAAMAPTQTFYVSDSLQDEEPQLKQSAWRKRRSTIWWRFLAGFFIGGVIGAIVVIIVRFS